MVRRRAVDAGFLVVLAGATLALRVPGLTGNDPYRDDAWPALATRTSFGRSLRLGVTTPGFEAVLRAWIGIDQETWWAQLPVLLASLATVLGVYLVARRVGCTAAAAAAGGAIVALSPIGILYATRLKPYSFDGLTALVTIAAALWVWAAPAVGRRWTALIAVAALAALFSASTVPVGVACIGGCSLHALGRGHRARVFAIVGSTSFAIGVLLYAAVVLPAVPPSLHRLWTTGFIDWSSPADAFSSGARLLDDLMAGLLYRHGAVGPFLLGLIALGALVKSRRVAVLCLTPVGVALAAAALERVPLGGGRTDLYLYPGIALAAAVAVEGVLERLRSHHFFVERAVSLAAAAGIVVGALTVGRQQVRMHPYPGVDMSALQAAVQARRAAGDGIIVSPYSRYTWALIEARAIDVVLSPCLATGFTVASRDHDEFIMPKEYVEDGYDPTVALGFAEHRQRIWYVVTDSPTSDTLPEAQAHEYDVERELIARGFTVTDRVTVSGGHADLLVLYR